MESKATTAWRARDGVRSIRIVAGMVAALLAASFSTVTAQGNQQYSMENLIMNAKERSIATIASFTATGNLDELREALNAGLDAGLTVNEIKEVLVQMYAYCGFPRSLRGLNTFIAVLDERKARGVEDEVGPGASPLPEGRDKYATGAAALEELTGQPQDGPKTAFAAFSPEIDVFLKEHLFADIFGRDVLTYQEREIATISALLSMGGVEPMVKSHMDIGLNVGLKEAQLDEILSLIESNVGTEEAADELFPRGERVTSTNFIGEVWVEMMVTDAETYDSVIGNVTFAAGARTNWHSHPGGQILLVTRGAGLYQEKGKPIRPLSSGDVVRIPPDVVHWHGASAGSELTHIAIVANVEKGSTDWLHPVSDEEYAGSE